MKFSNSPTASSSCAKARSSTRPPAPAPTRAPSAATWWDGDDLFVARMSEAKCGGPRISRYALIRATCDLIHLDVGEFDHLRPLVDFVGDELAELGSRHRGGLEPERLHARSQDRIVDAGAGCSFEFGDDLGRCALGRG